MCIKQKLSRFSEKSKHSFFINETDPKKPSDLFD